jgi:cyclophilin family peptidyl-prolyl cis-trans isomerase
VRVAVAAFALVLVAGACGSSSHTTSSASSAPSSSTTAAGPTTALHYGTGACPPATPPAVRPKTFNDAPSKCIKDGVDYGAVVTTSEGTFTIDLLEHDAPGTVNNFVVLARWGWFNGGGFHRVVPRFVIQAGGVPADRANPGYTIPDELPPWLRSYVAGSVAMANRGPDTGASEWFVCLDCSKLPSADYPIFGKVTSGMDVVQKIEALGTGDGPPSKPVTITSVTITPA